MDDLQQRQRLNDKTDSKNDDLTVVKTLVKSVVQDDDNLTVIVDHPWSKYEVDLNGPWFHEGDFFTIRGRLVAGGGVHEAGTPVAIKIPKKPTVMAALAKTDILERSRRLSSRVQKILGFAEKCVVCEWKGTPLSDRRCKSQSPKKAIMDFYEILKAMDDSVFILSDLSNVFIDKRDQVSFSAQLNADSDEERTSLFVVGKMLYSLLVGCPFTTRQQQDFSRVYPVKVGYLLNKFLFNPNAKNIFLVSSGSREGKGAMETMDKEMLMGKCDDLLNDLKRDGFDNNALVEDRLYQNESLYPVKHENQIQSFWAGDFLIVEGTKNCSYAVPRRKNEPVTVIRPAATITLERALTCMNHSPQEKYHLFYLCLCGGGDDPGTTIQMEHNSDLDTYVISNYGQKDMKITRLVGPSLPTIPPMKLLKKIFNGDKCYHNDAISKILSDSHNPNIAAIGIQFLMSKICKEKNPIESVFNRFVGDR